MTQISANVLAATQTLLMDCIGILPHNRYHLYQTWIEYMDNQGRSVVCFDVEAQFNISSPNIFHGHFRLGSFHIFNILKLRPGPLCLRLATPLIIHLSPPSAPCMHLWTRSALVQVMACRLFSASHYLNQCWLKMIMIILMSIFYNANFKHQQVVMLKSVFVNWSLRINLSEIWIEIQNVSSMKMQLKMLSGKWQSFCPRRDELIASI